MNKDIAGSDAQSIEELLTAIQEAKAELVKVIYENGFQGTNDKQLLSVG
ncbi:hypothetical protein [Brevibacillus migulae]|nr:hypothetical protein [Brevibacillus migulae]